MKLTKLHPLLVLLLFAAALAEEQKTQEKKPQAKKPEEAEKNPSETKPDEQKPNEKKPEDLKPEDAKPEDKKTNENKPEDKEPDDKAENPKFVEPKPDKKKRESNPEENKPNEKKADGQNLEEKKPEKIKQENQPDENKSDEKKPGGETLEGKKPSERSPDKSKRENNPGVKKPDERNPEKTKRENQPDEKKPDGQKPEGKGLEEKKPDEKNPDKSKRENEPDEKKPNEKKAAGQKPEERKLNEKENEISNDQEPCEGWCMFGKADPELSVDRAIQMENRRLADEKQSNKTRKAASPQESNGRREPVQTFSNAILDEQWNFYNLKFKANPLLYGPHMYHINPKHGRARPIVALSKQNLKDDPIFDKQKYGNDDGGFASSYLSNLKAKPITIQKFLSPGHDDVRKRKQKSDHVWSVEDLQDRYMRGSVLDTSSIDNVVVGMRLNDSDKLFLIGTTKNAQENVGHWVRKTANLESRNVGYAVETDKIGTRAKALSSLMETMLHTYQYGTPKVNYKVLKFNL